MWRGIKVACERLVTGPLQKSHHDQVTVVRGEVLNGLQYPLEVLALFDFVRCGGRRVGLVLQRGRVSRFSCMAFPPIKRQVYGCPKQVSFWMACVGESRGSAQLEKQLLQQFLGDLFAQRDLDEHDVQTPSKFVEQTKQSRGYFIQTSALSPQ